jgi:phosphatidate cytidylyltransferase
MLKQRIFTAIVALALLAIVLLVLPPWLLPYIVGALLVAGAWEWGALLGLPPGQKAAYAAVNAALMAVVWTIGRPEIVDVLALAVAWWILALIGLFFYPLRLSRLAGMCAGCLVIVPAFVAIAYLFSASVTLLVCCFLIVWLTDLGGYFAGKALGRVKLAPSISPGKTWEGVIGGMVLVILLGLVAGRYSGYSYALVLPFFLGTATISIVGDLTVSVFKRIAGVKDSGTLFPGHGGVLDRIDSIMAATPFFALGVTWLGIAGQSLS